MPLHGADQYLRADLELFFQQEHPEYELLFAARTSDDSGIKIVEELALLHPKVKVRTFAVGDPPFPNAKINSLITLVREAKHELLVMCDSDVAVDDDYLSEVTRIFADDSSNNEQEKTTHKKIGMATCLYRGRHTHGFWSLIETLAFSVAMPSGVLTANMLEGMKFALGPTIVARKQALEDIGGLAQFGDVSAEDFVMGEMVAAQGWRVELSHYVIGHNVPPESAVKHFSHQVRWAKTERYNRPAGHLGSGLIYAMPYGLLALVGGAMSGHIGLGALLLGTACMKGIIQCLAIGWGVVRDENALRYCWLYPVEDLMGSCAWMMSYIGGGKIIWRGDVYQLQAGGKMVRVTQDQVG